MITKKMIKDEVDKLPIELLKPVYQFIVEEEENVKSDKKSFYLNMLLNGPVINEEELENTEKATEILNSWNLKKF